MAWPSIFTAIEVAIERAFNWSGRNSCRMPLDPFFALSRDALCINTLDGHCQRVNPAFIATLGHSESALLSRNILDLLRPEDRPAAALAFAGLARGIPIDEMETRFLCAGGYSKWLAWSSTPFPAKGLAYTVARDCTRRKMDEEALLQSEARCVWALESTTDAFFAVDPDWRLIRVNQQAERLWMCHRDDLLGRSLWEAFPEAAGGPFHRMFEQVMCSGAPAHLEQLYVQPKRRRWLEVHAYPSCHGLAVYFRDVTPRRDAEQEIERTLQEKEVLLREVHHRVKNNLQVICSMLRLQERNNRDETLIQTLRECRQRVMAMAMLHEQLHRAKDFSNIDLGEYIRNLASSLFDSHGIDSADVSLRMDIEDVPVAVDTAIPCGLIVNELVSNALMHAFPERRRGSVSLSLHALPGGFIELSIADDGRGFAGNTRPAATRSLGLWLVELLADQIGAAVQRSGEAGTHYRFLFQEP